jgi:hypothetical protein
VLPANQEFTWQATGAGLTLVLSRAPCTLLQLLFNAISLESVTLGILGIDFSEGNVADEDELLPPQAPSDPSIAAKAAIINLFIVVFS